MKKTENPALIKFKKTARFLEKANNRNLENTFFFNFPFDIKPGQKNILLSEILSHPAINDLGVVAVEVNELDDEKDKVMTIPNIGDEKIWNSKTDYLLLELLSKGLSKSRCFSAIKQEGEVKILVFQRLSSAELTVLFFGYFYEKIRDIEIEIVEVVEE
ncbi:MAG: hypothetical protein PHD51_01365 [Patescibacteria group bacterium]|nr:hypothetical protein [Patescibacteria group bacterium]MDD5490490.1 hypothetical protein [Patescibacteria group bacterium]